MNKSRLYPCVPGQGPTEWESVGFLTALMFLKAPEEKSVCGGGLSIRALSLVFLAGLDIEPQEVI